MGKKIGLVCRGKGLPKTTVQRDALLAAGVEDADIWEDDATRKTRDEWLLTGRALEPGDTLVLAMAAALAPADERRSIERKLKRMNVAVEDLKAVGIKVGRAGRPPKHKPSAADRAAICELWWNKNVPREDVKARADKRLNADVSFGFIKRLCGLARSKPENE